MDERHDSRRDTDPGGSLLSVSLDWQTVLRDVILVATWVGAVSVAWGLQSWPTWAYYVVVFGGIVGYTLASDR